ncbi:MAG: hypothetical protein AB7N80_10460 [Bdellovibrionales bacterium]
MKRFMLACWVVVSGAHADPAKLNPEWGSSIGSCNTKDSKGKVWIFKQWHLGPQVKTIDLIAAQNLPQAPNQRALYSQLAEWIQSGQLRTVLAEGCEGVIDEKFTETYNGWNLQLLKAKSQEGGYDQVITHIPLKLEAHFGARVDTLCGDSQKLVQKHSLLFSDMRGLIGFKTRLEQYKNDPEKVKPYLDSFIEINNLPVKTNVKQAIAKVRGKLKNKMTELKEIFGLRNQTFVQAIQKSGALEVALVVGGLHAADLKQRLQKALYDCEVVEPKGYNSEDEKLIELLEKQI